MKTVTPEAQKFLNAEHLMLIDGKQVEGEKGRLVDLENPADGSVIAQAWRGAAHHADRAVEAARRAFNDKRWRGKTPAERERVLLRIAELIDEHTEALADLEVLNGGKLFTGAFRGEVPMAARTFRYYAGWCTKLEGEVFHPSIPGLDFHAYTIHEPVGVVAQIIPWNGPLVMAAWKLAPALAAGCSVVLKPAEQTPLSALYLGRLMQEAGVPDGVVNIVTGSGSEIGGTLAAHGDVNKVAFTGSTETGRKLMDAARGNLKRLSLELGGKSPAILFEDCDLEAAIEGAAMGIFGGAGQVCVAGSRIYAHYSIYDEVVEGVAEVARRLKVGPGLDPDSEMGPLISDGHRQSVHGHVTRAVDEGVDLICGGDMLDGPGYFYPPTVLAKPRPDSAIMTEEVFGPVVTVTPFQSTAEVVSAANDSIYGLAGSVWTRDLSLAHKVVRDINSGIIWINCHGIPDLALRVGGMKQSGWGRELGPEGLMLYTETKSIMAKL